MLGIVSALLLGWIASRHWNSKLDVTTNVIDILEKTLDSFYPKTSLSDSDILGIHFYRQIMEKTPTYKAKIPVSQRRSIPVAGGLLNVTLYYPKRQNNNKPPLIIYFHGGGFVLGSILQVEHITKNLAAQTNFTVASVEYRLAPEFKFPTAHDDSLTVAKWLIARANDFGFDPKRVIVAGDSAGGNLAAYVARELSQQVHFQLLIYPVVNFAMLSESTLQNWNAPILTAATMKWFALRYFNDFHEITSAKACPLSPEVCLQNLPPTLLITAEFDVLRDEGELYGAALRAAGNEIHLMHYNNTVHGFFGVHFLPYGMQALKDAAKYLVTHPKLRDQD